METKQQHMCPWWMGWVLINPLRKAIQNPEKILKPHVQPGMKVVDYGCAMGYFTLPMARMVGEDGRVYGIDIQKKMIDWLYKRSLKARLEDIINPVLITENTDFKELAGKIDFALLFAVVHEVPDKQILFKSIAGMLKPGGRVLFAEPMGHVTLPEFDSSVDMAVIAGLKVIRDVPMKGFQAILLERK
jgi:2-polyprenyl-3-methyl-5-hydroxy-6-metoxy-1,4-benzoquinol methylase